MTDRPPEQPRAPGHWSVKTFWDDGNVTNDWPHGDDYASALSRARRMRAQAGVVGVMLERWAYTPSGEPRLAHREQVYAGPDTTQEARA